MGIKKIIQNKLLYPEILWERPVHYYKAKAGKILVLAGSKGMTGAAILTCEAIFRSGTGILTLGFPDKLKGLFKDILPESMTLPLPSTLSESLAKRGEAEILEQAKAHDVIVLGQGLSANAETIQLIWELIFKLEKPLIVDAEGITAITKGIEVMRTHETEEFLIEYFKKIKAPVILTPTISEAIKLINAAKFDGYKKLKLGGNKEEEVASLISLKLGVYTILKDASIIAEPYGNLIESKIAKSENIKTGNASDVLSGIIGSFVAQNPDKVLKAIATATYLYELSIIIANEKAGERILTASDVIRYLPEAIRQAEE